MSTIYPGLQFYADVITQVSNDEPSTLCRTPSTYSFGSRLELFPQRNILYVVCKDGSVQSVFEPDLPIGWEISESENGWTCRISQVGFEPRPCLVRYHSKAESIRPGGHQIGSQVFRARIVPSFSRHASIYEAEDDGDPEVTSTPPQNSPASSPECPGAPRKARMNSAFGW